MIKEMCIEALEILGKTCDTISEAADKNNWDRDELFLVFVYFAEKATKEATLKETEER